MSDRVPGTDYVSVRDRRSRAERQRRAERDAARAKGNTDIGDTPVTICAPAQASGALHFGQRAGFKAGHRHASKRRFPRG